jgi:hypothetical protein
MADTRIDDETLSLLRDAMARHAAGTYGFEQRRAVLDSPDGLSRRAWADYGASAGSRCRCRPRTAASTAIRVAIGELMRHVGASLLMERCSRAR